MSIVDRVAVIRRSNILTIDHSTKRRDGLKWHLEAVVRKTPRCLGYH